MECPGSQTEWGAGPKGDCPIILALGCPILLGEKEEHSEGLCFCFQVRSHKKGTHLTLLMKEIFNWLQRISIYLLSTSTRASTNFCYTQMTSKRQVFGCHHGLFHFQHMPMGLSNASQLFQWAMENTLKALTHIGVMMYIDDIVIYSPSEEEHLQHL